MPQPLHHLYAIMLRIVQLIFSKIIPKLPLLYGVLKRKVPDLVILKPLVGLCSLISVVVEIDQWEVLVGSDEAG